MHTSRQVIQFYAVGEPFGEFSNFAPFPIRLRGREWPTTEHYFQAQKFAGTDREHKIRKARTPGVAARLGRDRAVSLRKDWEAVKLGVMREAVLAKFTQHSELRGKLLATGDAVLVEHTASDQFWGDGGDGAGENWLGRILMEVRSGVRAGLKTPP